MRFLQKLGYRIKCGAVALLALFALAECYQLITDSTLFTSALANVVFRNNFHTVVPNRLYRSAEMSATELRHTVEEYRIRTIIDLRLDDDLPDRDGVRESDTATNSGAYYVHMPLHGSRVPEQAELLRLLQIYDQAQPPVLVHCSSGTHRSGLASAVWLMTKEGVPVEQAAEQLSAKYGFFAIERKVKSWIKGQPTIDVLLTRYADARRETGIDFRSWVKAGMPQDVSTMAVEQCAIATADMCSEDSRPSSVHGSVAVR